jgi:hypothetical protein
LHRLALAFRCFFGILFHNRLSDPVIASLGLMRVPERPPAPPKPPADHIDGTVQILSILQRDSRLIDFLMEDISAYEDEQVGAAVRTLHDQCRDTLKRYVELAPVIDGVEGTFTRIIGTPVAENPAALVKFVGNVPAGVPQGGVLRHKGWRAARVDVPVPAHGATVVAPAEIEIE